MALCLELPAFAEFAFGTDESLRPAQGKKMARAGGIVRKLAVKRRSRHGFVCFPPACHARTNREHLGRGQGNPQGAATKSRGWSDGPELTGGAFVSA